MNAAFLAAFNFEVARQAQAHGYGNVDPALIVAQAWLETGGFTSPLFLVAHNAFGMRLARRRRTLAVGEYARHAWYRSWADSVQDYFIRQRYYGIPDGPTYAAATAASGYATASRYLVTWLQVYSEGKGRPSWSAVAVPLGLLTFVRQ